MKALHAQTSSYEYDVFVDVLSSLVLSPMPQVQTMSRHARPSPVAQDPSLENLQAAIPPTLHEMWAQQHLLADLNACVLPLSAYSSCCCST
jgi:hypothetical protein